MKVIKRTLITSGQLIVSIILHQVIITRQVRHEVLVRIHACYWGGGSR